MGDPASPMNISQQSNPESRESRWEPVNHDILLGDLEGMSLVEKSLGANAAEQAHAGAHNAFQECPASHTHWLI